MRNLLQDTKGQVSIAVLTAAIGAILALSGVVYGITVNGLKEADSRFEKRQNEQQIINTQAAVLLGRIDERLSNIERALGVKNSRSLK